MGKHICYNVAIPYRKDPVTDMEELRIMSNNLWWCTNNTPGWEAMGADCSNTARVPGFARMYRETAPDIIGLQECSARMTRDLMVHLAETNAPYAMLWGGDTPILYHRDKFALEDSTVCIYPEEIPGLEGCFNNLKTKSFCVAVLRRKGSEKHLIVASTHLMYKSEATLPGVEKARAWQMGKLIDQIELFQNKYHCPAVIVGDFNTWPSGAGVQTALARGFAHAHDEAAEADETTGMHYCCDAGFDTVIQEGGFDHSIDHILVRGLDGNVLRYQRCFFDYCFRLSDHMPLWIDIEF